MLFVRLEEGAVVPRGRHAGLRRSDDALHGTRPAAVGTLDADPPGRAVGIPAARVQLAADRDDIIRAAARVEK